MNNERNFRICCGKERKQTAHRDHLLKHHGIILSNRRVYICYNCRFNFDDENTLHNHRQNCKSFIKPKRYTKLKKIAENKFIIDDI